MDATILMVFNTGMAVGQKEVAIWFQADQRKGRKYQKI